LVKVDFIREAKKSLIKIVITDSESSSQSEEDLLIDTIKQANVFIESEGEENLTIEAMAYSVSPPSNNFGKDTRKVSATKKAAPRRLSSFQAPT
jgi:hypothetical protein